MCWDKKKLRNFYTLNFFFNWQGIRLGNFVIVDFRMKLTIMNSLIVHCRKGTYNVLKLNKLFRTSIVEIWNCEFAMFCFCHAEWSFIWVVFWNCSNLQLSVVFNEISLIYASCVLTNTVVYMLISVLHKQCGCYGICTASQIYAVTCEIFMQLRLISLIFSSSLELHWLPFGTKHQLPPAIKTKQHAIVS